MDNQSSERSQPDSGVTKNPKSETASITHLEQALANTQTWLDDAVSPFARRLHSKGRVAP